jgi:L-fucose isomerase-like protein
VVVSVKKITVASFASRLHGESYYESLYELFKKYTSKGYLDVVFTRPITSLEEAKSAGVESKGTLPVVLALTGGTSRLIWEFTRSGDHQRVLLIGHGEHNSLASAISARSRLDDDGVWNWLFHCSEPSSAECAVVAERAMRIASAVSRLLGSRVLLVSETGEKGGVVEDFEEKFEASVDVVSTITLASKLEEASRELVEEFYSTLERFEFKVPRDKLSNVAKFYAVVKSITEREGYVGVAVDCFPYLVKYKVTPCLALAALNTTGTVAACEADLASLALMVIYKGLTGLTGWIANTSMIRGNRVYFAHCTVAFNMVKSGRVVPHFESGYPYALSGELVGNVYTFASLSRDYSVLVASTGRLVASGLLYETMCRTQGVLEVDFNAEKIPLYAPVNHHVLVPGDIREELRAATTLLGIDYVDYRELA